MPRYTFQAGAHWPNSLIDLTNYQDADNTVGTIVAQIKAYQEAGDFDAAQALIDQHAATLKKYCFDSAAINKYVEELRNLEIYTKAKKQQIFYEETEDSFANYAVLQDVWLGNKSDVAGVINKGNVTDKDVLEGVTFMADDGTLHTGSMTDNGAIAVELAPGATYNIPVGYHNGGGIVTATGTSQSEESRDLGVYEVNGLKTGIDVTGATSVHFMVAVPTVMQGKIQVTKNIETELTCERPIQQFVYITGFKSANSTDAGYAMMYKDINGKWRKTTSQSSGGVTGVSGNIATIKWNATTEFNYYAW